MEFDLQFRPYCRTLAHPLEMSRGTIRNREGVLLRFAAGDKLCAFSEITILPYFGTETLEQAVLLLASLGGKVADGSWRSIPQSFFATRYALQAGMLMHTDRRLNINKAIAVSFLLPAGASAIQALSAASSRGYRTFKWKIGLSDSSVELPIFKQLNAAIGALDATAQLRLDANGGLSLDTARLWLENCAETHVEFVEQPLAPTDYDGLLKLVEKSPVPIALDESVATAADLERITALGWNGLYVVKPSRLGDLERFFDWRERTRARIVYSSALETSIGTEIALRVAASDSYNNFAGGFGVAHWFSDDSLYSHPEAPMLTAGEAGLSELEQIWNALAVNKTAAKQNV